jgi:ATP-dependent RNA helicase DHX37/DHR1
MDPELSNLINKEISDELLKELNITTLAQYNEYIQADKKSSNKNSKKKIKEEKISKKKQKELTRKRESILNKKIKNEQRNKIIESLEKRNTTEQRKIIDELNSTKNLGKKRKNFSKEKQEQEKSDLENSNSNSEEELDIDIEELNNLQNKKFSLGLNLNENISDSENENENNNTQENFINKNNNLNKKNNLMDFTEKEKADILNEIRQFRIKELQEEQILNLNNINNLNSLNGIDDFDIDELAVSLNLEIPQKENIILINRNEEIQKERLNLPIVKYEQEIMDRINHSLFSVICGETGSGKSTQIPQFLHEYGYTKALGGIVITQPRRVAAISLANRVSEEMNCKLGEEVGYQIRYDSHHYSDSTVIKYVTDGILLREIESDSFLLKYSVVIIDEAHERTINTDIIIGLLSQVVKFRYLLSKNKVVLKGKLVKPLRLVVMSATMQVDEFLQSGIFSPKPSFIKVEARRFPVTVHHLKRTDKDYVEQAFKMTCKIHQKLPMGGILVFLTGKQEILRLCERLNDEFSGKNKKNENEEIQENGKFLF